jgi:hypothetical protein
MRQYAEHLRIEWAWRISVHSKIISFRQAILLKVSGGNIQILS